MSHDAADLTHSNSLFFDAENDILYYNARNPNTFYKINHSSSEVIWGLGEHGNFSYSMKKDYKELFSGIIVTLLKCMMIIDLFYLIMISKI